LVGPGGDSSRGGGGGRRLGEGAAAFGSGSGGRFDAVASRAFSEGRQAGQRALETFEADCGLVARPRKPPPKRNY
jgi:hypothetical protein